MHSERGAAKAAGKLSEPLWSFNEVPDGSPPEKSRAATPIGQQPQFIPLACSYFLRHDQLTGYPEAKADTDS